MTARPFVVVPDDHADALDIVGEQVTALASGEAIDGYGFGPGGSEMLSITSRLGTSRIFADMAREIAPVDPDLERLAEVVGRHGLKLVV